MWYGNDGTPKDAQGLKDAREKDFEAWTVLGALMMASAFGEILNCPDLAGAESLAALYTKNVTMPVIGRFEISDRDVAAQLYLSCMSLSAMLALKCVNDNMIKFLRSVGTPVEKQEDIKRVESSLYLVPSGMSKWSSLYPLSIQTWLEFFGLKWGLIALYQSIYFFCLATVCGIYLKHGPWNAILPGAIFQIMYLELRTHTHVQHTTAIRVLSQEESEGPPEKAKKKSTKEQPWKRTRSKSPAPKRA
jgi:hypothetical protein